MPFQPKENMTVAPIFRRTDIQNMSQEERQQFYDDTFKAIFDTEKVLELKKQIFRGFLIKIFVFFLKNAKILQY